jgi:adenylate cyclase
MPDPGGMTASVLAEPRIYDSYQAAAAAGVSLALARRFWRALGYATVDEHAAEFTDSDLTTLRLLTSYIDQGLVSERSALQLTRLLGRTVARLAESQVDAVAEQLEGSGIGVEDQVEFIDQLATQVMPDIQFLIGQAWRRHIAAAVNRLSPEADEPRQATTGVGFADMIGFTELSRRLSETALLELVESFEDRCVDIIGAHGGRIVKMIGDEVLFTATTPDALAEVALHLLTAFGTNPREPGLRIGIAFGPVVRRLGDVFGNTVNLASRLTGLAEPNTVRASQSIADALSDNDSYRFERRHDDEVRGLGSVASHRLTRG